jgi:hypothetical protein
MKQLLRFFAPLRAAWYKFSYVSGTVSSSVLLALVFFLLVTPVGLVRRLLRKDSLSLRQFGKGRESALIERQHLYTKEDMIHTF